MIDQRLQALNAFYESTLRKSGEVLSALGGDASFRRYFRGKTAIAVDSPNETQKNKEFVSIAYELKRRGVRVPEILAVDYEQGFLLEEDLGNVTFAQVASGKLKEKYYKQALDLLPKIATVKLVLPKFDANFIATEFEIFTKWLLHETLHLSLNQDELNMLEDTRSSLTAVCLAQRQIAVHRDYHSRNLMEKNGELVCIDFQDMVLGPVGYDAVSLIFDCYVDLGEPLQQELLAYSFELYKKASLLSNMNFEDYRKALTTISLQRHLKVLGIFNRLHLRDGKNGYLKDLPLVLKYALHESRSAGFSKLYAFLNERVATGVLQCVP